jgi:hypothetical protein
MSPYQLIKANGRGRSWRERFGEILEKQKRLQMSQVFFRIPGVREECFSLWLPKEGNGNVRVVH